jgi:hypothetical protein
MAKFRKKPVVIDAMRLALGDLDQMAQFLGTDNRNLDWTMNNSTGVVHIVTREGTMRAEPGDWIIRGVKGEFYPCKPDIFGVTYEPVSPSDGSA